MDVTPDIIVRWLDNYAAVLAENRNYLTELDGAIGDNDHGINMDRGFRAVRDALPNQEGKPIDDTLKMVSRTLIKTVGGASGPLYGTVFLRMGTNAAGKETVSPKDFASVLAAGRQGIVDRGKAEVGDKTMLDAWDPAARAYAEAVEAGQDLPAALQAAAAGAEAGMKSTTPLVARKGRASYLGERSAGHQDPGATSSYLFFKTLRDAAQSG